MKLSDIQFDLAILYFKEEKYAEAVEVFQKLLQEHPDNLQVIDMLQRAQVALGELR
ncbi:tetratricopeptide repeat protein [candidate division KSB1 bacterium]|nr:tetratricopeptide repeat protein [candidate division KSB1 bacterium]